MSDPELRRRIQESILAEITEELATARLDEHAILRRVASTLSRRTRGTWMATLMNRDPSTSRVVAVDDAMPEVADYAEAIIAALDRPGQLPTVGLSAMVIETGTPVFMPRVDFNDLLQSLTPETAAYVRDHPAPDVVTRSPIGAAVVPMRSRGVTIGTLGVLTRLSTGSLPPEYLAWLQEVADQIGIAIENARLFAAAVDRLERLQALQGAGLAVLASEDLRLTLQIILDAACTSLGVDAADVALLDEADGTVSIAASRGFHSTSAPDARFPLDSAMFGAAFHGRRFLSAPELESTGAFQRRSLFAREGFRSYFGVPLVTRNKLRGVLEIFHRSPLEPDAEWLSFLEAIGTVVAIAIDHAGKGGAHGGVEATGSVPRMRQPAPVFSRGEKAVLPLVVEGLSNQAIAEQLNMSESTAKFHVRRILEKARVENRTELARKATQEGWI